MANKRWLSRSLLIAGAAVLCASWAVAVEESAASMDPNCIYVDPNEHWDPNDYWDPNCDGHWDPNEWDDPNFYWDPNEWDPNQWDPNAWYNSNDLPYDPNEFFAESLFGAVGAGWCPFTSTLLLTACVAGMFLSGGGRWR